MALRMIKEGILKQKKEKNSRKLGSNKALKDG